MDGFKRWLCSCLLLFCVACQDAGKKNTPSEAALQQYQEAIAEVKPLLQSGDLIFRSGTDEVSQAARSMNRVDTSFSHCGLVLIENDTAFVYHAIGGNFNPSQKLRRDPVEVFCEVPDADRFAVYRYKLSKPELDSLSTIIRRHYAAGLKFDLYFNMLSDDVMYCSEFVYKCLERSLLVPLSQTIAPREWPYGITPDDLYLNGRTLLIKRVELGR